MHSPLFIFLLQGCTDLEYVVALGLGFAVVLVWVFFVVTEVVQYIQNMF